MLDFPAELRPPAPVPRAEALGPIALLRVLADNPLEAWTAAHFEQPIVMSGLSMGRVAVVSDPVAIRRVLLENCDNYQKDWLQRRVLSAGLTGGLLTAEGQNWKAQRRALAPLFARKTVTNFSAAMVDAAGHLVERIARRENRITDLATEATRVTLEVLERTIFSDGLGRDAEDIRVAMKKYFETIGRIDPFDMLGVPSVVPRPGRWKVRPMLRLFESAIDSIISTRRERIGKNSDAAPRDILTLLLEATDPETGEGLSEAEIRANILTFIAAGHETTANCITWSLFLLSQSPQWRERVQAEADRVLGGALDGLAERLVETRAVIDEANRLYPPIAALSRVAMGPDELAGVPIKAGTMIVIASYVLHRHRALWRSPTSFNPNRFLGSARNAIDRFAYLPFGVGPRICIGSAFAVQEASIVVATIMRHFTLETAPGYVPWPVLKVTLRPRDGLPMLVRRR
ncbi:MAG TPA: cytochrome P450 [Pseudolabrys sp.]